MYQFEKVGSIASGIAMPCAGWTSSDFDLVRDTIRRANLQFFGSENGCRLFVPGSDNCAETVIIGTSGVCAEADDDRMEFETEEVVDMFENINSVDQGYWTLLRRTPLLMSLGSEIRNWLVAQGSTRTLVALGDLNGGPTIEIATVADEKIVSIDFSKKNIEAWHDDAAAINDPAMFIETV